MKTIIACCVFCLPIVLSAGNDAADNVTLLYRPVSRQLYDFGREHQVPIGLWTKSSGEPTEIRDIHSINSDQFNNQLLLDSMMSMDGERIPERVVHAKGTGAFGYFEVTHDISEYTYADVFNGIGKKTPVVVRLSTSIHNIGGTDLGREFKGFSVKFYTRYGNLDLTCLSTPVYLYRDPILFPSVLHTFKRNPRTNLLDFTALWDLVSKRPIQLHALFWQLADYGIPDGYRKMDAFPIHTFELANKKGERHYVRFNFRTEQGVTSLTSAQAAAIQARDMDYFTRDLYDNIENRNYPAWKLEMDVMTIDTLRKVDFDPFDVTRLWKNGTFFTVQIGRLVLNRNIENHFRDVEQLAFNQANLVPGIPGPVDWLFRGRRNFYRDTQNHRLGRNHNNILINKPLYAKTYNRDGKPPTLLNEYDAPNYYPNSFNGAIPYVDEMRPREKLLTFESNAVDLEPSWYFYNFIIESEEHRQRFIENVSGSLAPVTPPVIQRVLKLFEVVDPSLAMRVNETIPIVRARLAAAREAAAAAPKPTVVNVDTVQNTPVESDPH